MDFAGGGGGEAHLIKDANDGKNTPPIRGGLAERKEDPPSVKRAALAVFLRETAWKANTGASFRHACPSNMICPIAET